MGDVDYKVVHKNEEKSQKADHGTVSCNEKKKPSVSQDELGQMLGR